MDIGMLSSLLFPSPLIADQKALEEEAAGIQRGFGGYRKRPVMPIAAPPPMAAQPGILQPNIGRLDDTQPGPEMAEVLNPPPPAQSVGPTPTDVSSQSRPVGLPMSLAPPPPPVQVAPSATQPGTPDAPGMDFSGILGKIASGLGDRSSTLMALGAGFAGAPNIGQGISRGLAAAVPAKAADEARVLRQGSQAATVKAMVGAGVPYQLAIAALGNPEIMKSVTTNYMGDRKAEIKTVKSKDAFGNETEKLVAINPYTLEQKEIGGGTQADGTTTPAGGTNMTMAPGVTSIDATKVGDEYLTQFSPEVQAGVKNYLKGDSLPTGRQQLAQTIKMVAQKYGEDVGTPANDQAYYQKKNFKNSMGNTNSGVGMQVKGFQQGLNHMVELSDKLEKLGNSNGLGFAPLAHGINAVRGTSTAQGDVRKGVDAGAQALAGEIGKLYSGSNGGGVHERSATKALFDADLSPKEMAGALESTLELMRGGLQTIEQRRDGVFGPNAVEHDPTLNFLGKDQQAAIAKIEGTIRRLRGEEKPETKATPATKAPPPGVYVYDPKRGLVPAQ